LPKLYAILNIVQKFGQEFSHPLVLDFSQQI